MSRASLVSFSMLLVLSGLFASETALAKQYTIVAGETISISDPETATAYHDELTGTPRTYTFKVKRSFTISLQVLVPKQLNPEGKYRVAVNDAEAGNARLDILDIGPDEWPEITDGMAGESYYAGPKFQKELQAGSYQLVVSNNDYKGKYVLLVGTKDPFSIPGIYTTLDQVLQVKAQYYQTGPTSLLSSSFWLMYLVIWLILGAAITWFIRFVLTSVVKSGPRGAKKNINILGRVIRFLLAVGLLVWAVMTNWNPIPIFFSGAVLFETFFGWCGLNALLGRNECSMR